MVITRNTQISFVALRVFRGELLLRDFEMSKWILTMMVLVMVAGCIKGIDPNSGKPTYTLDPNTGQAIQTGLDTATVMSNAGTILLPQYAAIFTLVGGILGWAAGLWRKLNPVLSKALTSDEIKLKVITSIAKAVEAAADNTQTEIKANVAKNLESENIAIEGKQVICEAKAQ